MLLCAAQQLGVLIGANRIFEEFAFEIQEGDRVGLVGRNGTGKTTLLKTLAGLELPDKGSLTFKKGTRVGYLAQLPAYGAGTTVRRALLTAFDELIRLSDQLKTLERRMADPQEAPRLDRWLRQYGECQEAFARQGGYELEAELMSVANGLQLAGMLDAEMADLSGGEQTKVGLGTLLLRKPDLLLLDEPTNHLDVTAIEWLEGFIREYPGTLIAASHDRYFLDRVATRIFDLEQGELDAYDGNYTSFVRQKEEKMMLEFAAYREQQKKIKQMQAAIKRLREWAAIGDNEKFYRKAASMQKALDRMEKLRKPLLDPRRIGLRLEAGDRSGNDVVRMKGVRLSLGGQEVLRGVDLHVRAKERVAVIGDNGSGKSTLLKAILGELAPSAGEVRLGAQVKIGYLSQHPFPEEPATTLIEEFRREVAMHEGEARQFLAKFLFYGNKVFTPVKDLSGGEKMRLRLAQLMCRELNLLVLDEPTNHLDIDSREVLEDTLEQFEGTILCVSHDRHFLNRLFPITHWLERGRLTRYEGNYDYAKTKREERLAPTEPEPPAVGRTPRPDGPEPVKRRTPRAGEGSRSVAELEEELQAIERRLAELEAEMSATDDVPALVRLDGEWQRLKEARESLYEELEERLP